MCELKICTTKNPTNFRVSDRAVGYTSKFWNNGQTITISFLDGTSLNQEFVKKTCVKWLQYANLKFVFIDKPMDAMVRISFNKNDGAWSYIGKDVLNIARQYPTMNLGWVDEQVVLHEFGHTLGLLHEHQNPRNPIPWNEEQVIADLSGAPNYWDLETIRHNVFDIYDLSLTSGTNFDNRSIMGYQVPSRWTLDGTSIPFNEEISATDASFIMSIYPKDIITDTEDPPKIDYTLFASMLFKSEKDLKELNKSLIIRLAVLLDIKFDPKWVKSKIRDAIIKHLKI